MEKFLYKRNLNKNPKINVFFAFPAIESFAMASLGYLSIFKKLDLMKDVAVERIFSDTWVDTKETKIPISQVDAVGFSNSFEIDILAILKILDRLKIPFKSSERTEVHPLVFAGGPVLSANPLPFADFYDFIVVGDAQDSFDEVFKVMVENCGKSKTEILNALNKIKYVWIPAFGREKKVMRAVDKLDEPVYTPILSDKSFFKDVFVVEIERGCPQMCNFCLASWENLPVRFVSAKKVIEAIDLGLQYTRKIALLGAHVAIHPEFDKILSHIREQNKIEPVELSVSSLRADLEDANVIKTLVECGAKTATIAIEAGSERLRRVIHKNLTKEQIFNCVKLARDNGLSGLKIYVMIGLPTETDEDIKELVALMTELKRFLKDVNAQESCKTVFDLTLSLSTFVPKAQTPFQATKRDSTQNLVKKTGFLKKELHKIGVNLRPTSIEWDNVQAILSRMSEPLTDYLIAVYEKGANLGAFKQVWRAFEKEGKLISFEDAARGGNLEITDALLDTFPEMPWDFIQSAPREQMKKACENALKNS